MIDSISVHVSYKDQQEELPILVVRGRGASLAVGLELAPKDPSGLEGDTPAAADTCTSGNLKEVCRGI